MAKHHAVTGRALRALGGATRLPAIAGQVVALFPAMGDAFVVAPIAPVGLVGHAPSTLPSNQNKPMPPPMMTNHTAVTISNSSPISCISLSGFMAFAPFKFVGEVVDDGQQLQDDRHGPRVVLVEFLLDSVSVFYQ